MIYSPKKSQPWRLRPPGLRIVFPELVRGEDHKLENVLNGLTL